MPPELEHKLLAAAYATHKYWLTVESAMGGLETGESSKINSDLLDQYAEESRVLCRLAVEMYEGDQIAHERAVKKHEPIPKDWEVQPLQKADSERVEWTTCGHCGLSWDDNAVTSMTPAPAGRCPFEPFHIYSE